MIPNNSSAENEGNIRRTTNLHKKRNHYQFASVAPEVFERLNETNCIFKKLSLTSLSLPPTQNILKDYSSQTPKLLLNIRSLISFKVDKIISIDSNQVYQAKS